MVCIRAQLQLCREYSNLFGLFSPCVCFALNSVQFCSKKYLAMFGGLMHDLNSEPAATLKEISMANISTKRISASSIKIDTNVRCQRIYPVEDKKNMTKTIADLKTVGIKLSRVQAIHLARVLLAASQEWEEIDITAWRVYKRQT